MTLRLAACAAVVLAASGCASTPLKQFPEFPTRYDQTTRTHLIADVAVLDDVKGRRDQLTLGTNRALAQSLTDSLAVWMEARGYTVDQTYPGAVGLLVNPAAVVRLRADAETEVVLDSAAAAPYYVDDAVLADPLWESVLWGGGGRRASAHRAARGLRGAAGPRAPRAPGQVHAPGHPDRRRLGAGDGRAGLGVGVRDLGRRGRAAGRGRRDGGSCCGGTCGRCSTTRATRPC